MCFGCVVGVLRWSRKCRRNGLWSALSRRLVTLLNFRTPVHHLVQSAFCQSAPNRRCVRKWLHAGRLHAKVVAGIGGKCARKGRVMRAVGRGSSPLFFCFARTAKKATMRKPVWHARALTRVSATLRRSLEAADAMSARTRRREQVECARNLVCARVFVSTLTGLSCEEAGIGNGETSCKSVLLSALSISPCLMARAAS